MIKIGLLTLLMGFANILSAQDMGIVFQSGITWKDVLEKAKRENKYVFVDCYTTWCTPCKRMDKEIFSLPEVGTYFNNSFICMRVQIDTTKNDSEEIKKWYKDAQFISNYYKINAFPTFLFLNPDGRLVHRAVGGFESDGFIRLANEALNPKKQYYAMLNDYMGGKRDTLEMKQLAISTNSFGDRTLAKEIARNYLSRLTEKELCSKDQIAFIKYISEDEILAKKIANIYIKSLMSKELFTRENLSFVSEYTNSTRDYAFKILYNNAKKVDSIMGTVDFVSAVLESVIIKEEISPFLNVSDYEVTKEPNWDSIRIKISKKVKEEYVVRAIANSKSQWFYKIRDWKNYTRCLVDYVEKYGSNYGSFALNNSAWYVFEKSNNTEELKKALVWAERALKIDPYWTACLDTYANLLYKLGKIQDALRWEDRAVKLDPNDKGNRERLEKMKRGVATW